jgi:hypothetical protein
VKKLNRRQLRRLLNNTLLEGTFGKISHSRSSSMSSAGGTDGDDSKKSSNDTGQSLNAGEGLDKLMPSTLSNAVPGISKELATYALSSFRQHYSSGRVKNNKKILIVDYTIPGADTRLWCIEIADSGKILLQVSSDVAHGSGNGAKGHAVPTKFSNTEGTHAASVGAFVSAKRYHSKAGMPEKYPGGRPYGGLSMRIKGLDPTNSNDYPRAIVIHGAWYREKGKTGRSWGCLATAAETNKQIVDFLGIGSFGYKFGGTSKAAKVDTSWA